MSDASPFSTEMITWVLSLTLSMQCVTWIGFYAVDQPCTPRIKPVCCDAQSFYDVGTFSATTLLRTLASIFIRGAGLWFYSLVMSLSHFGIRIIGALWNEAQRVPSLLFLEEFVKGWC